MGVVQQIEIGGLINKDGTGGNAKSVVIQMYRPPWAEGEGEAMSIEVNT